MSDQSTLLLNANWQPISILPLSVIGWQEAIKLLFMDKVLVIEEYDNWVVHSPSQHIKVPAVCVTKGYFNSKKVVRFSRRNLYMRDLFKCQYCAETFEFKALTIDHVVPRASGGKTTWENCVTACKPCNHKKGSKWIKPITKPYRPDYYGLVASWKGRSSHIHIQHPSWYQYLGIEQAVAVTG